MADMQQSTTSEAISTGPDVDVHPITGLGVPDMNKTRLNSAPQSAFQRKYTKKAEPTEDLVSFWAEQFDSSPKQKPTSPTRASFDIPTIDTALPPHQASSSTGVLPEQGLPHGNPGGGISPRHRHSNSMIMQKQLNFFLENLDLAESDDEKDVTSPIEDEQEKHASLAQVAISNRKQQMDSRDSSMTRQSVPIGTIVAQKKRQKKKKKAKPVVYWCCQTCTYHNNLFLGYCELCGVQKPLQPQLLTKSEVSSETLSGTPQPTPSPSPSPLMGASAESQGSILDASFTLDSIPSVPSPPQYRHQNALSVPSKRHSQPPRTNTDPQSQQYAPYQYPAQQLVQQEQPQIQAMPPNQQPRGSPQKVAPAGASTAENARFYQAQEHALQSFKAEAVRKRSSIEKPPNSLKKKRLWVCRQCTFAENPVTSPVCKVCGQVPAEAPPSPQPPVMASPTKPVSASLMDGLPDLPPSPQHQPLPMPSMPHQQTQFLSRGSVDNASGRNAPAYAAPKPEVADMIGMDDPSFSINHKPVQPLPPEQPISPSKQSQKRTSIVNESSSTSQVALKQPSSLTNVSGQLSRKSEPQPALNESNSNTPSRFGGFFKKIGKRQNAPDDDDLPPPMAMRGRSVSEHVVSDRSRGTSPKKTFAEDDTNNKKSPSTVEKIRKKSQMLRRARSKSPNRADAMKEVTVNRSFSVADMSQKDRDRISKRLLRLGSKKELISELDRSIKKLRDKLSHHASRIMRYQQEIKRLESDKEKDIEQWEEWHILEVLDAANEYYNNKMVYYNGQIELERLHVDCFTEKLTKLETARKQVSGNRKWSIDDIRMCIESAFHTAWRIRLHNDVVDKKQSGAELKQIVDGCKLEYLNLKKRHNRAEVPFKERQETIILFLRSVLFKYESIQQKNSKNYKLGKLSNEEAYYHEFDSVEQRTFNSFILDQRTKEGRIVNKWLKWIVKKATEVILEDICDFIQKLAHTFVHTYELNRGQYYECVRIFTYRCILSQTSVSQLVDSILHSNMTDLKSADQKYQTKTFWMRTLKADKLQINKDFWIEISELEKAHNADRSAINKVSSPTGSSPRKIRASKVVFKAGESVPFAESINLLGELEIEIAYNHKHSRSVSNATIEERNRKQWSGATAMVVQPDDGLYFLLSAIKCINQTAERYRIYNKKNAGIENPIMDPIGNDDLFPIVLYCVIQSRLENPHRFIRYIECILPTEATTMGAAAFALSVLKAAVQYVVNATPTEFGMDADIEIM